MFKNYLKIAWRNLTKNKGYSFINTTGLAIGLASCIVILLYINNELSYDEHHEKADRIVRIASKIDFSGNYLELATTSAPMGPTLKADYPAVKDMIRFRPRGSFLVGLGNKNIKESDVIFADPSVFNVFTIPLLRGDKETALTQPFTVAVSQSIAHKYFDGSDDVVGETLIMDDDSYEITAVYEDMPETSHFHFDFLMSMETIASEANNNTWLSNNFRTYLLFEEGTDPDEFHKNFETIKNTYIEPQIIQFSGDNLEEFEEAGNSIEYELQPLTDIHLHSDMLAEFKLNGNIAYVYLFSGLALFILVLACINFMNLATARSSKRSKEVGIRKTLGSLRKQLAVQFLSESFLITIFSAIIALILVEVSLPYFNSLSGLSLTTDYLNKPALVSIIVGAVLVTGLLAGSYPAILLSGFKPIAVLKGSATTQGKSQRTFRSSLVVFQFSVSLVVIIGLLGINKQLDFIQNKSLGFDKEQKVIVHDAYALDSNLHPFKELMLRENEFKNATVTSYIPVSGFSTNDQTFWPKGQDPSQGNTVSMQVWRADENYVPTFGMELIEGRNFNPGEESDNNKMILNEALVKQFGYENPVGEIITTFTRNQDGSFDNENLQEFEIIGVVKNFHFRSMKESIAPLALLKAPSRGNIVFSFNQDDVQQVVSKLETNWAQMAPGQPFSYSFLDDRFDRMYRTETTIKDLMTSFSVLILLIACLGLLGLSAFTAEQRSKEIGIRKVLGANVAGIIALVSKDFLKLIVISFLIAAPISFFAMREWLQNFIYKTNIGFDLYIIAGIGIILVAFLTVSWQSIKAALINPVDSLKSE